jgi:hypothetical protein
MSELRKPFETASHQERDIFWAALALGAIAGRDASDLSCSPPLSVAEFAAYLQYRAPATTSLEEALQLACPH